MSLELRVSASINVKQEFIDEVLKELKFLVDYTRKERGCVQYDLHYDLSNSNHLVFFEVWKSKDDFEEHKKTQHFIECFNKINHMIESQQAFIMNVID
ncbi:putative quinol monooxygenase [Acinetobacter baumannii]